MTDKAAFICEVVRTPIGRLGGRLSTIRADDLGAEVIRRLVGAVPELDPSAVDEVIFGCANQAGEDNRNVARMSALLSGLPISVPGVTVNRLCASGLEAVAQASRMVRTGEADLVIAGGVENMSRSPFVLSKSDRAFGRTQTLEDTTIGWRFVNKKMLQSYDVDSMPTTADNVAEQFDVSRMDQDKFALRSQEKAASALASGRLAREISPVTIPQRKSDPIIFENDEHPRPTSTLEGLSGLRTVNADNPSATVTAGNASGVNDGAACMFVASEQAIDRYGLTPKARILGAAAAGVEPRVMGIGPVESTNRLLPKLNLKIDQFDVIELNEAFAAQALAVVRALNVDDISEQLNPNGGAIALGHPLGMTGARLALSTAIELESVGGSLGLVTLCVGVGQGMSLAMERA